MADFLMRHGSGYKYVRAVPKALHDVAGQQFWTRYIGAVPHEEAKARALFHAASDQQTIDGLRRLSADERDALTAAGGLKAWRKGQPEPHPLDALALNVLRHAADIEPDPDQPDAMQAKDALLAVKARRELKQKEADAAIVRKLTSKLTRKGGASLLALVDLHEKTAAPRSYKTTEKARLYLRRFIDVVGDMAATDVTREHVLKFRDHLEANGYSESNVAQHLAKLQALFNLALSEGIVKLNPAQKIKARKAAKLSGGKQGFDGAQMKRIFAALDGETSDFQWIIRLLAYHGARSSEICQLKCGDVTTLSGVEVIRIHDQNGSVKNRQSVRDVPLHPKCKAIIGHAAKRGADAWLFPSLTPSKQGRGHNFQNYANRKFLRLTVGITDRAYSIHSLRHAFSTACREAEMADAIKYALMGHALGRGEGGKYGEGPSLKLRAKWIAKVDPLKV